jgi:hypothetical protein
MAHTYALRVLGLYAPTQVTLALNIQLETTGQKAFINEKTYYS